MFCAFCRNEIDRLNAWKDSSGGFFCSEFCAEERGIGEPNLASMSPFRTRQDEAPEARI